jgi:uncharacterized membrane protein
MDLPRWDEPAEPVGVVTVLAAQLILGLGIVMIGQRTKNKIEFYCGLAFFIVTLAYVGLGISYGGAAAYGYGAFNLLGWAYVLCRIGWIALKKEPSLRAF